MLEKSRATPRRHRAPNRLCVRTKAIDDTAPIAALRLVFTR